MTLSLIIQNSLSNPYKKISSSHELHICSSVGPYALRLSRGSNSNKLYGIKFNVNACVVMRSKISMFSEIDFSYAESDTLNFSALPVIDLNGTFKTDASLGVKNKSMKITFGIGKDFTLFSSSFLRNENKSAIQYNCNHFVFGVSLRLNINCKNSKNKISSEKPETESQFLFGLKKLSSHRIGVGLFENFYYEFSKSLIGAILIDSGIIIYSRWDYRMSVTNPAANGNVLIVAKNNGGYINAKPGIAYFISNNICIGCMLNFESEFMSNLEIYEPMKFYGDEESISQYIEFPQYKGEKIISVFSRRISASINLSLLYRKC